MKLLFVLIVIPLLMFSDDVTAQAIKNYNNYKLINSIRRSLTLEVLSHSKINYDNKSFFVYNFKITVPQKLIDLVDNEHYVEIGCYVPKTSNDSEYINFILFGKNTQSKGRMYLNKIKTKTYTNIDDICDIGIFNTKGGMHE